MENWNTEFSHQGEQMTHIFNNGVKVITDFSLRLVHTTINGEKINTTPLDELSDIEDYTTFLRNTRRQADAIPGDL